MSASMFEANPRKVRQAELLAPPNALKEKIGSGGLDAAVVEKAQKGLEANTVDFAPIGRALLDELDKALEAARSGAEKDEAAIEGMIHPAMQMKAQGAMFHAPLVTDLGDILVNFLETVTVLDKDVFDIVGAHRISLYAAISGKAASPPASEALRRELMDACNRYYKSRAG